MEEIWVINPSLRMVLLGHPLTIRGTSYGSLRLRMSNLKAAMDHLLGLISARVDSQIIIAIPPMVGTSTPAGTSPTDEKVSTTVATSFLGGTNLLGGTAIRPRRAVILGGTPLNDLASKGVIKKETVRPALATIKQQV